MTHIQSTWERLGSFDSDSAASREQFAKKYASWIASGYRKTEEKRTANGFEFTSLRAQDSRPKREADRAA
jgi:hypothetical protein